MCWYASIFTNKGFTSCGPNAESAGVLDAETGDDARGEGNDEVENSSSSGKVIAFPKPAASLIWSGSMTRDDDNLPGNRSEFSSKDLPSGKGTLGTFLF